MDAIPDRPPIITELSGLLSYIETLEVELRRTKTDCRNLEIIATIIARRSDGKIEWTAEEIQPARDEPRTMFIGALDLFLDFTTKDPVAAPPKA